MPKSRTRFFSRRRRRLQRSPLEPRRAKRRLPRTARWGLTLLLVPAVPILGLRFANPPFTAFMLTRGTAAPPCGELGFQWTDLSSLPKHVGWSAIAAEDQRFYQHSGFDLTAIRAALREKREGGRLRGASTLSQQVTKNLFLWSDRSWLRKALEAYLTFWLELLWPKQRILEVYLNVAQFGPCTFGVEAASQHFFQISARALSPDQAASLMTALPNPHERRPTSLSPLQARRMRQIRVQAASLANRFGNVAR